MKTSKKIQKYLALSAIAASLAACGGYVYTTVGGKVSGLVEGDPIYLITDAGYRKTVDKDGSFAFDIASNASYNITISQQPYKTNCAITNGSGKMTGEASVTNVAVNCVPAVPIGGSVAGMTNGSTLTLAYTAGDRTDSVLVGANGSFQFNRYAVDKTSYAVNLSVAPPAQYCTIANPTGTVNLANPAASATVAVSCVAAVPVKFALSGLSTGTILTLVNNADGRADKINLTIDGSYAFNFSYLSGVKYAVTVDTQPTGQTCKVQNGTGVTDLNNPTGASNITVTCAKS